MFLLCPYAKDHSHDEDPYGRGGQGCYKRKEMNSEGGSDRKEKIRDSKIQKKKGAVKNVGENNENERR